MSATEAVQQFWSAFCRSGSGVGLDEPYQVWYFGNSPEMAMVLAELVISGKKTATASLAKTNELEPENAPVPDGYSVVTDFDGQPLCVVLTTEIRHLPFSEVDAGFASDEGEGDLTLEYWRRVHRDYYSREAADKGFTLDEDPIVCCERFRLLYPK